jgi:hypothetical protein
MGTKKHNTKIPKYINSEWSYQKYKNSKTNSKVARNNFFFLKKIIKGKKRSNHIFFISKIWTEWKREV